MLMLTVLAGALVSMDLNPKPSILEPGPSGTEIVTVPSKQDPYIHRDIRFRLTIPSQFLHQQGEEWTAPISQVNFALDTRDDSATKLSPVENPDVIIIALMLVSYDGIDANYNKENPKYTGNSSWPESAKVSRAYGLNYVTNEIFPGAPFEEYLFDEGPFFRTEIRCKPSGNAYPTLCTLRKIGRRGGGIRPHSSAAIETTIIFRRDRLPDWEVLTDRAQKFLNGKITVVEWDN
jgi:hypothetical protein